MSTKQINLTQWAFYSGGWFPTSGYVTLDNFGSSDIGCAISPYDGTAKQRAVIPIIIPEITGSTKNKSLSVKVTFLRQSDSSSTAKVRGTLRTAGRATGYNTTTEQGTLIGESIQNIQFDSGYDFDNPKQVTFSFDISGRTNSEETLYLWITTTSINDPEGYDVVNLKGGSTVHSATLEYTAYTKPTSPTITTASTVIKPSDSITVKWSGASAGTNVSIKSLTLNIRKGSASGTVLYTKTGISSTATSQTVKLSDFTTAASRGDTLYATIQAIGSISGYDGTVKSGKVGSVNSLPAAPSVTQNGTTIDASTSITFTVTAGADTENKSPTLAYRIDEGPLISFTSPLRLTVDSGLTSGSRAIYFYTYDGLEYNTTPVQKTFTVNYAPVISSATITYEKVASGSSSSAATLATIGKISYTLEKNLSNPQFKFRVKTGTTTSAASSASTREVDLSNNIIVNASTKTITIDIISLDSAIIPYGYYFYFDIQVSDGVAFSDWCELSTAGRRPSLPIGATFNSITNDSKTGSAKALSQYFKDQVTISLTNPAANASRADIRSVEIISKHANGTSTVITSNKNEGITYSTLVPLTSVSENDTVTFSVKVIDVAGQENISTIPNTMIRTSNLQYAGTVLGLSQETIKPLSNTSTFTITHPFAQASGTQSDTIEYLYKFQTGNTAQTFSVSTVTTSGEQREITLTASNVNSLLTNLIGNTNTYHTVTVTVTAVDGFGATRILTNTFTADFREPPVFNSYSFKIKHDYDVANSNITVNSGTEVTSGSGLDLRMFNAGEGIILALPKATDLNNDISEYQIFLSRNDFVGTSSVLGSSNVTFGSSPWLTLSLSQLQAGISDNNYYYYRYPASQYTKNEYFYFKVRVKDSKGNYSSDKISSTYIIGCRTASPSFNISNVSASRAGTTVTLRYNFSITDLGGSATSTGWNPTFYNSYKNFERTISGYTPKVSLKIEISPDQDFRASNTLSKTLSGGSPLLNFTSSSTQITGFAESHAKIFMRFTLIVSYGLNSNNSDNLAIVTSSPQIYTHFGSVPTVSHRTHQVGINTNSFSSNDVLVVENYSTNYNVVLKGSGATNNVITINLLDGSITGAIIDGGSW